jgi:integrase
MGVHYSLQYKKSKNEYTKHDEVLVCVRYYHQGRKMNISSGVKCKIKDWNENWEKTIKREPILKSDSDWKYKNLKLKDKESEINNIVLQIEKDGEVPYVDIVKSHLRDNQYVKIKKSLKKIHFLTLFEMYEKWINSDSFPNRTSYVKTINTSVKEIKSYTEEYQFKKKVKLLPQDIDEEWMWGLIHWSYDKGIQPTTIRKRVKTLVSFSNWLKEKHHIETYIKTPKNFKYINEDREVFFLTRDEVQKIKEFDEFQISNEKHLEYLPKNTPLQSWYLEDKVDTKNGIKRYTSYEVYKDMLLFLCGIGCRFGDLVKMKVSNFEFDSTTPKPMKGESFEGGRKGIFVFNMEKSKTNKQIRVPINKLTYDIFKKYSSGKHISKEFQKYNEYNEYLFPRTKFGNPISNQKFNKHSQEICKIIGINESVRTYKVDLKNKIIEDSDIMIPKWNKCSSHIGRRTFIREHIELGTPIRTIMSLSGHSSQKVFDGYYKVLNKDLLKNNNEMFSMDITPSSKSKTPPPSFDLTDEKINQLKRWKDMFDMGLIDEEEYKNKKKLILG